METQIRTCAKYALNLPRLLCFFHVVIFAVSCIAALKNLFSFNLINGAMLTLIYSVLQYVNHVLLHVLNVQYAEQVFQIGLLPLHDITVDSIIYKVGILDSRSII